MAGILKLTAASPVQTFAEPVTVQEVETFIGITTPESGPVEYFTELEGFIQAAREQAELLQGRDLVAKQYDLLLPCFHCPVIELRQPLAAVDLIRYRDSSGVETDLSEGTDYIVDLYRGEIMPPYGGSWPRFTPWPSSAVLIRFTMEALTPFPARLKVGMLQLVSDWYNDRLPFATGPAAAEGYPARLRMLLASGGRSPVA